MTDFFKLFVGYISSLFDKLNEYTISFFEIDVPLASLIFTFVIFAIILAVFWKGARA